MIGAMRGEWLKLITVRSPKVLIAVALLSTWLIAGLGANDFEGGERTVDLLSGSGSLAVVLLLILGIQILAQEYRFGTIRTSFTAVPVRSRVIGAKVVVGAAVGGVTGAVVIASGALVSATILSSRGYTLAVDGRLLELVAGYAVVCALSVAFGIGIGAITRNPTFGITAVLLLTFLVEPLVTAFTGDAVSRWLPLTSLLGALPGFSNDGFTFTPWYISALVFAGWSALALVIGGLMVERRDA